MRVPGTKATRAMANSLKTVSQEKRASREVRVDRMEPVCTQRKLEGIKPGRRERKQLVTGGAGRGRTVTLQKCHQEFTAGPPGLAFSPAPDP